MKTFKDQVVVITGASSGIGRATAVRLARKGAAVALIARRTDALEEVAAECREAGAETLTYAVDVTDADAVDACAAEVAGRFGRIDGWVNNAAVNLFGRVEEVPVEDWHRVVETNLFGSYHGARAVLPWFREQGSGVLVNVSSVLGEVASPYQSAYVASKHAIRGLSASLRQELDDVDGIDVCMVMPGPVDTPLFQHAGNYTGSAVKAMKPVTSPERVARTITACLRRPRAEVAVGWSTKAALAGVRAAPGVAESVAARGAERDHFADEPAAPSSGNVHEPEDAHTATTGGWRNRRRRRLGAIGVAAAAAVVALARSRR